ncbi:integral membrane protein SYS1-like protein [Pseudohyphozyma bogoriensis]|nr:integral membrane protein SYS1-like protein [Pseudohyphozyma bogoriensis]
MSLGPPRFRVQGWDPLLITSQIISLQSLHYLTLSILLPPLLSIFASPVLLSYEGGPTSVSMVMDWREFLGRSTVSIATSRGVGGGLVGLSGKVGEGVSLEDLREGLVRVVENDPMRGWVVALGWVLASLVDVFYLYHLIRRPTHILDFSLTLLFNHLLLTTYFSSSFPTSFFYWFILSFSSVAQIVLAEQCCVRRDMNEGFSMGTDNTPIIPGSALSNNYYSPAPPGSSQQGQGQVMSTPLGVGPGQHQKTQSRDKDVELGVMRNMKIEGGSPAGRASPSGGRRSESRDYERAPLSERED